MGSAISSWFAMPQSAKPVKGGLQMRERMEGFRWKTKSSVASLLALRTWQRPITNFERQKRDHTEGEASDRLLDVAAVHLQCRLFLLEE